MQCVIFIKDMKIKMKAIRMLDTTAGLRSSPTPIGQLAETVKRDDDMTVIIVMMAMVMVMMAMVMMVMEMIILISGHMPGAANHTHQPDKSEAGKEREAAQCRFSEPVPSWCRLVRDLIK